MRIAVTQLKQETNSFNPQRCTLENFRLNGLLYDSDVLAGYGPRTELGGAVETLRRLGGEVVPLVLARSVSYGPLTRECFAHLKGAILSRLAAALPVDGVFLSLHGAMAVEDDDDPEGTLLAAVRQVVGPRVVVGSTFDLHAHITPAICKAADVVEGYRTYPHDDGYETGARAVSLMVRIIRGEIRPMRALVKMNMLVPGTNQQTAYGPAAMLWYEARQVLARREAISVSIFFCHSKLDVPGAGAGVLVTTDVRQGPGLATGLALIRKAWELRHEFDVKMVPPREAVRRALAVDRGPVVVVDLGDVPGGGGAGDSNAMLAAMLAEGVNQLPEPSLVAVVDPEAAQACHQAGVGATVTVALGNKLQPFLGEPVAITGTVLSLHRGQFRYIMGNLKDSPGHMGRCAVLQVGALYILITSFSSYEYADEQYRAAGLDLDHSRMAVVRSGMNFKFAFKDRARHIILADTPGMTTPDLRRLPFRRVQRPLYPLDPVTEPQVQCWIFGPPRGAG